MQAVFTDAVVNSLSGGRWMGDRKGGMQGLSFLDDQDKRGKKRLSSFPQPLSKNTKITTWDPRLQFQAPPNSGYFVSKFATSVGDLEMVNNHFKG